MTAAISVGAAVAIGATAAVGAGATIYAANKGASATKDATNAAIGQQNKALSEQAQLSQPYRDLGTNNIDTYQKLLSGDTAQATLEQTPGYNVTRNNGIEAAKRSSAASGMNLSGNQVAGVEQYGSELADQTYQQQLNNLLQPIQLGQAASAGQAANVGASANNVSNALINQGNTNAGIDANLAAGLTKTIGNTANQFTTANTLAGLRSPGGGGTPSVPTYTGGYNFDDAGLGAAGVGASTYGDILA